MRKLGGNEAFVAMKILFGKSYLNPKGRDVVQELLDHTQEAERRRVATRIVGFLLDELDRDKVKRHRVTDTLALALDIALTHCPSRNVSQRLVTRAAREGFYGRFPYLSFHLLNRSPSVEEVTLLISAYVRDTATRSIDTECKLMEFARAYLPKSEAREQIERISKFRINYNSYCID